MAVFVRPFADSDEDAVVLLWQQCGLTRPWNDPRKDVHRKMQVQRELFLVGEFEGKIVSTVMAGYEGHRGWINYLAVHPDFRRRGFGRQLMEAAERSLRERGAPKINLQVRASNVEAVSFYQRVGFTTEDVINMGKRLGEDGPRSE